MGRLTVAAEVCERQPEIVIMILRHLQRENGAVLLDSWVHRGAAEFWVEGRGIPLGAEQFQIIVHSVLPGIVTLKVVTI
jgi:hypothetical protein